MIVLRHEGCGEAFITDEHTALPKVCPRLRGCKRECNNVFELVGTYHTVEEAFEVRRKEREKGRSGDAV